MPEKKIIAVVGATGAQGGGLARAILADTDSEFAVRAITRDANSGKAKALEALGAEVVSADLDDLETLKKAFAGAYGAYCVTFYWAHFSPEKELAHAKNLAAAAKAAGLRHVIWSTLEDTRKWVPLSDDRMPTLMGKYKVPHFDAKGEADHFFADLGVPTTYLLASFFWENFIGSGPKKGPDGTLALTLPIGVAGEHLTGSEMAAAMSTAFGRTVRFNDVPPEVFRGFGFPGADDLGNMFQFYRDFEKVCNDTRDVARTRSLAPGVLSFGQWLEKNASRIPLE